jgi:hypothetical protein
MPYYCRVNQGVRITVPQGANDSRQSLLPEPNPLPTINPPRWQMAANPQHRQVNSGALKACLSDTKGLRNWDKPGYSDLNRNKRKKLFFPPVTLSTDCQRLIVGKLA